jgi:DHA2 family multidrug resistance protein-like MFS transporter
MTTSVPDDRTAATSTSERTVPDRAGPRQWAGLAVLALPCLVVAMDAHLLHLALPRVAADLRLSGEGLLWVVDIYVFLCAGSLLTMGMVGDRIGRRRLLLLGGASFAVASVLATASTTAAALLVARALLGVTGATLMPSTLALIRTMFRDAGQRRRALGVWTASFAVGGLIGPVAGGLVLTYAPWRTVFLLAVPPMLLLLAVGPHVLPESRDPGGSRVDLVSAVTSLTAVLAVVLGLKSLAGGESGPRPWAALAAGTVLAAVFVRRQRRHPDPALDPAVLGRGAVAAPLAVNALSFFVLYGTQYLIAQFLQLVLGLSPLEAALWGLPGTVGYLLGSAVGPALTRRVQPVMVVVAGLVVSAIGFGLLMLVGAGAGLPTVVVGTVVFGFGLAPVYALTTEMVVAAAPPHRAGVVSATQETGAELGGALGIALLGSVSLMFYRAALGPLLPGTGDADTETLAGALTTARDAGGPDGMALAALARDAFTSSYVVAAGIGVALLLTSATVLGLLARSAVRLPVPARTTAEPGR